MVGPEGKHPRDAGKSKLFPAHRRILRVDDSDFLGLVPHQPKSCIGRYSRYLTDGGHDLYVDLRSTHRTDLTNEARPHHRVSREQTDDHRSSLGGIDGGLDSVSRRSRRIGVDDLDDVGRHERFRYRHRRLVREHVPGVAQHVCTSMSDQVRVPGTSSNESDARCSGSLLLGSLRGYGNIGDVFLHRHRRTARLLLRRCFLHRFLLLRLLRLLGRLLHGGLLCALRTHAFITSDV